MPRVLVVAGILSFLVQFLLAKDVTAKELEGASSSTINLIWKARGLQAIEKLEPLTKLKVLTPDQRCQLHLESMFMQFANPELAKVVVKKSQGIEWFILVTRTEKSIGQISFGYSGEDTRPTMWKVVQPDNDWQVGHILRAGEWHNIVTVGKCNFLIDVENPIKTIATATPN